MAGGAQFLRMQNKRALARVGVWGVSNPPQKARRERARKRLLRTRALARGA